MKKVLTLVAFASIIALPAFAQSFDPDLGTGNLVPPVANMGARCSGTRQLRKGICPASENTRHNKAWNADAFACHRRSTGAQKVMQPRVVDLRQLRLVLNNLAASSDAVIKNGPSSGVPALLLMGATECMRRFHGQQGHQG